ncbi:ATP-dependent helicase [Micrococcus luteus]|uniref:UvrD-helicase domain-containing protein n=1 Tax=Micrococcus luteus TaxID=1270 RepID=UPI00352F2394
MRLNAEWLPADGITLEPNALAAVREQKSNVVVTAGPGAGKSELLAQRADFLLRTGECPYPRRILAIAFKVDAASNIRERVRRRCGEDLAARFDSYTFHAFAKRIVDNYRILLVGKDALDADYTIDAKQRIQRRQITYNDLVDLAIQIVQTSRHARIAIRQTYTHVFLDEFQDATGPQYRLLKEIFLGSPVLMTAVGDTKQRIMTFAGALEGIMEKFAVDFNAERLTLYQNFRSAPVLRRMQNRMVQVIEPAAAVPFENLLGADGFIRVLPFDSPSEEARTVADQILGWLKDGTGPGDIAVIVRQEPHFVCADLMAELLKRGIPSRNEQVHQDLLAEPVGRVLISLMQVLAGLRNPAAYDRILSVATMSARTEEAALRNARAMNRFVMRAQRKVGPGSPVRSDPAAWRSVVAGFIELITMPVLAGLSPNYLHGPRLGQIIEQVMDAFENELSLDGDPLNVVRRLSDEDAIRILTIHKSKGLEFEKVVVLGVEEELFWSTNKSLNRAEFFVAISRAKEGLVLTYSRCRSRPEGLSRRWDVQRNAYQEFLGYAVESESF